MAATAPAVRMIPVYDAKGEPLPPSIHQMDVFSRGNVVGHEPAIYHIPKQSEAYHSILMTADKPSVPLDISGSHMLPPKSATVSINVAQPTTVMFGHLVNRPTGEAFNHTGATVAAQPDVVAHLNPEKWPSRGTSLFLPPGQHSIDVTLVSGAHSTFDHSLVGHTPDSLLSTTTARPSGNHHVETASPLGQIMTKYPMPATEKRVLDNGVDAIAFSPDAAKQHLQSVFDSHVKAPSFAFQAYPPLLTNPSVKLTYGEPAINSVPNVTFVTDQKINVVPRHVIDTLKREAAAAAAALPHAAAADPACVPVKASPMSPPLRRAAPKMSAPPKITMGRRGRDRREDDDECNEDECADDGDASPPPQRSSSHKHYGRH